MDIIKTDFIDRESWYIIGTSIKLFTHLSSPNVRTFQVNVFEDKIEYPKRRMRWGWMWMNKLVWYQNAGNCAYGFRIMKKTTRFVPYSSRQSIQNPVHFKPLLTLSFIILSLLFNFLNTENGIRLWYNVWGLTALATTAEWFSIKKCAD